VHAALHAKPADFLKTSKHEKMSERVLQVSQVFVSNSGMLIFTEIGPSFRKKGGSDYKKLALDINTHY